ncbi:MAG: regulatory protein GemA [Candidatus Thiodiazotropha sp. (ex Troendleina suluensis)]|nr:regulatory protein GemA [Candidatus Thiodiazotropha sp. (ex Troendleina suluensis)]
MKNQRKNDLAKIHIGAKELGMDPHDKDPGSAYRTMLWNVANVRSSADLSATGRQAIIDHLKSRGWKPLSRGGSSRQAGLIYHIWNKLADADVVHHREGLSSWLQSITRSGHPQGIGWQKPEFMPIKMRSKVIEQLKEWAKREGVRWK